MRIVISASYGPSLINFRGDLIKEMIKRGHKVICTSIEPVEVMQPAIGELGAKYYQIPGTRTGIGLFGNLKMLMNYIKVYKILKPDLCFLYMSKPIAFGGIAAILCNIKRIAVFVTGLEVSFYSGGFKNRLVRFVLKTIYRFVHKRSEEIFFMNTDDYRRMLKCKLIPKTKGVIVHGSGINMEHFVKKTLPENDTVLMTARLLWSKGVGEYIKAAQIVRQSHPQVEFLLVGGLDENPEALTKEELDEVIHNNFITYCGYQTDVRPYIEQCSIFVLPSYHEGNGRSVVEAEAVGRPIITTNAPGCRETVIDGYNGFLIPTKDEKTLAEKIIILLNNQELKRKMADYSHQFCLEKFNVIKINHIFLDTLHL